MTETLKDLVDMAKQRQGVTSGRQLAQKAQDHGHQIDRTQINDMAAGRYRAVPHENTIKALTWLSGVEENRVRRAAGLADAGEPFTPHPDAELLSTDEREAVNNLIRVLTRGRRTWQRTSWDVKTQADKDHITGGSFLRATINQADSSGDTGGRPLVRTRDERIAEIKAADISEETKRHILEQLENEPVESESVGPSNPGEHTAD